MGEERRRERIGGSSVRLIPSGGWDRRGESQLCLQWAMLSETCPKWEMREEKKISGMYSVGDAQCQMSLVWDGRIEDLWHVGSGGRSVIHVPIVGDGGGKQDFGHLRSGGWSVGKIYFFSHTVPRF